MIADFDTDDVAAAIGALLVYSIYTSRDVRRFKVDTSMWARIERFTKASAKRANTLAEFVERLKPRLSCESIRSTKGEGGYRVFIVGVLSNPNSEPAEVLNTLYRETSLCVLLVRERLEREKAIREALEAEKKARKAAGLPVVEEDSSDDYEEIFEAA